tara:strand:+ start:2111 stop:2293 length:183 start_codon:yes stop_codon:yes gene_type:complete
LFKVSLGFPVRPLIAGEIPIMGGFELSILWKLNGARFNSLLELIDVVKAMGLGPIDPISI